VIIPGASCWQIRDCERIITGNETLLARKHFLIGITRLRNETLILRDALDYVGNHVDASSHMMTRVRTGRWKFSLVTLKSSWS
jgi:hypothetical protein